MGRQPQIYTNFKEEDIQEYLNIVIKLINEGKRTLNVTKNNEIRLKNKKFMRRYSLKEKNIDNLMKSLTTKDFCYAIDEENEEYADVRLFIFCKEEELDHFGTKEAVDVFIKLKIDKLEDGSDIVLYISFHKRERSITYLFRDKG
jgi:hypothetical protein